ncbi:hypothetical protein ISO4_01265 [Alcanivorax venustensis ISO4]|jgi:hypothetical protein|uniref:Uncharacterized protein n=1 Tax=Alloalcanivorax venustensis ISO4 TaxID=1177184 RepID=A0ABS0AET3_9GAMM|nr:hypothetical protein [Alloalcanivorax venustensis]MBF5052663.1 hypothetical protein [Alloalcanivorax venustensis ISO4]
MEDQEIWQRISRVLFDIDPMGTCCKENDCFEEYDGVAMAVADRLEHGRSLKAAVVGAFDECFGADPTADAGLNEVVSALEEVIT